MRFDFGPEMSSDTEQDDYVWSERDNRCALLKIFSQPCNKNLTNIEISMLVGVSKSTVSRVRAAYTMSGDIYEVLERKAKPQEDARKVRSKEWIKGLQKLIDKDPTTSTRKLAKEMSCGQSTIIKSIQQDLKSRSYRRQTGQFLSQALIDRRLIKCTKLLTMLKKPQEQGMIWFFSSSIILRIIVGLLGALIPRPRARPRARLRARARGNWPGQTSQGFRRPNSLPQ